ncbi:MAG: bifunctional folylpolyglutamate synthase/dihydrofolate synthase [Candidatus Omnitrophica bacterium]|nr:bifunctional folylpolyglutamate synthase/dihydrofolate synthase [Candidatus Omnitrophota bacterium]
MEYARAIEFLDSFTNYEKDPSFRYPEDLKLDRMRALAKELGNPQNAYESVLIAGSKGKGSTAAILSSILRMENFRVGLYTSPHLLDLRERVQVNGLSINEIRFAEIMGRIRRALDTADWRRTPPTTFEILTALAFSYFKEMKVQIAVLEVGLGGLYDSTNIANAKAAGLAPISLEHTDKLGKTVAKIAVQKCGVVKGREVVVSAPQAAEAESVIQKAAEEREARLLRVGKEIRVFEREHGESFQRFDIQTPFGNFHNLELGLLGRHQIDNAAVAIGLAKGLETRTRLKISEIAVRRGVLDARWPGRMEKFSENPTLILDGAQNAESVKKLILGLQRHFHYERLVTVLGVSSDKDLPGILGELSEPAAVLVATQSQNPRALPAKEIARRAEDWKKEIWVEENAREAVEKASALSGPRDLILVTGSLYLVGEIKKGLVENGAPAV